MNKVVKILLVLLFTIITLMTLSINISPWTVKRTKIIYDIGYIIKNFNIILTLFGIFVFNFYYKSYFTGEKFSKKHIYIGFLSAILSIIIIGSKLMMMDKYGEFFITSFSHLFKCSILFFGLYFIFYSAIKSFLNFEKECSKKYPKKQKKKLNKFLTFIDDHPIISTIIFLTICKLPYIIVNFPFVANGDTFDVLCQVLHDSHSWSSRSINLVNSNVYLNTHHPLLFTLIFGFFARLGWVLSDLTLGVFLYTIFQSIIYIGIFAFLVYYLKKINIPLWIRIIIVLFLGLTPTVALYSITAVKDTPSAVFTLVYMLFLLQIIRNPKSIFENKIRLFVFLITIFFVIAFRSNGIITILCSYPFLFIMNKKYFKKLLIVLFVPIISFVSFNNYMYNHYDVSRGSKREMLSVPFMQIGRLMRNGYDSEFTKEDKKRIDKVLDYKSIKREYYPNIADPIKNRYNKNATDKDLNNFFKVWFKYLCKHPNVYIKSIMTSTYQYFFPDEFTEYAMVGIDYDLTYYFKINTIHKFRKYIYGWDSICKLISDIPIIGLLLKVSFYDWVLLFSCMYIIYKKKYRYLIVLAPLLGVLAVCLLSPLNGSIRYILPIVFGLPMCLVVDYMAFKECSLENKK